MGDPGNLFMLSQLGSQPVGVLRLRPAAQGERLEAGEQHEGAKGVLARPHVTHAGEPSVEDEGHVRLERPSWTELLPEVDAVVGCARRGKLGVLRGAVRGLHAPVEVAAVDDDPSNGVAVAANPLRAALHDDICAKLQRPAGVTAHAEGVVHDERHLAPRGDLRDALEVRNAVGGVRQRLHEDRARPLADALLQGVGLRHVEEGDVDAQGGQGVLELRQGAAVELPGSRDVVPSLADGQEGQHAGGLARRGDQG
mmetsp:Transcript_118489/g.347081  ORF Transcript_118489/g.347081 Transcript_118489/m.347081 type:complete len:254 (-) Transcript_118489:856-1617(-)